MRSLRGSRIFNPNQEEVRLNQLTWNLRTHLVQQLEEVQGLRQWSRTF